MAKRRKKVKPARVSKPIRERRPPQPRSLRSWLAIDPGPWAYWLLLIVAFGWLMWANREVAAGEDTLKWRETVGTVAESSVSKTSSGGSSGNPGRAGSTGTSSSYTWHVAVSYRYEVEGLAYSGSRVSWNGDWSFDNASEAHEKKRALDTAKTIPVFYDPARPSRAVLVRGGDFGKLVIGVLMVGAAVGLLVFSYQKQRPVNHQLPPNKRRGPMIRRALLGGFLAAVLAGGLQYLAYLRNFA